MSYYGKKTIELKQLKDAMRYVFGDIWNKADLSDYDSWCGFSRCCEDVWSNLDGRKNRKKKGDFSSCPPKPPEYEQVITLPFIGTLYRIKQ